MSDLKFNPRTLILLLMILIITGFRLLVTFNSDALKFANFSSIGAVALFGGAYFKDNIKAFAFPLLSLFLSDFILATTIFKEYSNGFLYEGWYWTYLAFALMVLVGRLLLNKINAVSLLSSTLSIVFIHWVVTDFGVWFKNPSYTQDFAGFWLCLERAIPFEIRFLEGTIIYGAILFGAFEILKAKFPALKFQAQQAA
ncbi:hypothetical protein EZ449_18060 [Pedobacter frigidisoli]|uniref:Uncharacterized protein n=1 Tax=Pedobacter frigidisoli TaxID=2530455 RepID=A0A4R0NVW1_9SPHI|nr:DUF6580 family putative transport protein [Pedobacter frigidisoli]TCD04213.1 hypothetical protein EZ449_18060 [Pedobacter frigidisoli]